MALAAGRSCRHVINTPLVHVHVLAYALHVSRINTKARFSTALVPKRTGWMQVYIRRHVNGDSLRSGRTADLNSEEIVSRLSREKSVLGRIVSANRVSNCGGITSV